MNTRPGFTERVKARRDELGDGARVHHPSDQDSRASPGALWKTLQTRALELGFLRVGALTWDAARPPSFGGTEFFSRWLDAGYAGEMSSYLDEGGRRENRGAPATLLSGARSLVVVALAHEPFAPARPGRRSVERQPEQGATTPTLLRARIARYAQGGDYHHAIKDRLLYLADIWADLTGQPLTARAVVDTGPLLEREAAALSGLGFIGKNTLLIIPGQGSGVLLGALVSDSALDGAPKPEPAASNAREPSLEVGSARGAPKISPEAGRQPASGARLDGLRDVCGSCRACLDVCPTDAFPSEYVLDARRCISYLTIELVGTIPREHRRAVGERVFGCDECQVVCPFNSTRRAADAAPDLVARATWNTRSLVNLLFLGSAQYRALVRGTALRRTSRLQLARNAAVALGNSGDPASIAPLLAAAQGHPFELVAAHAAWALGELGTTHRLSAAWDGLKSLRQNSSELIRAEVEAWFSEVGTLAP